MCELGGGGCGGDASAIAVMAVLGVGAVVEARLAGVTPGSRAFGFSTFLQNEKAFKSQSAGNGAVGCWQWEARADVGMLLWVLNYRPV